MVNFNLEMKNLQPINIKDMQLKYRINDEIIKSIILYNKAIAEIKENNIDLAIKDLKNALSYNKGFAAATKLLGLCYFNNKEYKKAKRIFKKMINDGIYDDLAKEYLNSLATTTTTSKKSVIVGVSALIVIGFFISYKFTSKLQNIFLKFKAFSKVIVSEEKADINPEQHNVLNNENAKLYKYYKNIEKELNKTKSDLNYYKSKYDILLKLSEIEQYYKEGDYEKAASNLVKMKNIKFDNESKIIFDKLWSDIKTKSLWTIYNEGNKLYKEGKYKEALPKLRLIYELDQNLDIMPWITYQIGKCYKETNDNTNALVFFKKIIDNYPNSKYAYYSKIAIKQIRNK